MLVVPILAVLAFTDISIAQEKCVSRDYGNGGTVCVCNSTYCDTIPRPQKVPSPKILVYTSNQAGQRFEQSTATFRPLLPEYKVFVGSSEEILAWEEPYNGIFIDSNRQYQSILGWGGAFTDSTGINLKSVSETLQETILRSYFSEDGLEYNVARVPIGGTDFSVRPYSYDDGPEDPDLRNFKLAQEDFDYKIPYILKALNMTKGKLKLFCSAWTAPKWMKTNNAYNGFGFIRKSMYQAWADYYVKFLNAYQQNNITFWGMTTGNEPADVLYPMEKLESVGWPSWLIGEWISENLGPTIRKSNHSDIKIMVLDDQRVFLPWYLERAFRDNSASEYIDGIAVHWYLDQYVPPEVLSRTQERFPDKFILGTEACVIPEANQSAVVLGSWERGVRYSLDIIQDVRNYVTGWVDWNMVLDLGGGPNYIDNFVDALIIVNATSEEFYKQPMYYHLGHFSKFVPRGSVRILSKFNTDWTVQAVAFQRPDNSTAVVLLNNRSERVLVNITDVARGTAPLELSENSITTILYW